MSNSKKKYEAVLFDMDGLMFDTERMAKQALYDSAAELGLEPDMPLFISITGCSRAEARARLIHYCGDENTRSELLRREEQKVAQWVGERGTPLKPGLKELVLLLDKLNIKKAIVSCSLKARVFPAVEHSGIGSSFELIITGEEVKNGKPSPDAYLLAAEKLGVAPECCLVLEDTVSGATAGASAGMDVALIPDLIKPTEEQKKMFRYYGETLNDMLVLFE